MRNKLQKAFKSLLKTLMLAIVLCGLLFFAGMVFYKFNQLIDIAKPIWDELDKHWFTRASWGQISVFLFGLLWVAFLLFMMQVLLSIYEKFVKKELDAFAEKLIGKFEKWYKE